MSFYVTPDDCSMKTSYLDWLDAQGLPHPEDEWPEEAEEVGKILSLEYCHWVLRRTGGGIIDGSNCEDIWHIRNDLVKQYEQKFGKTYFNLNDDNSY